jgi:hypothetical protein
MEHDAKAPAPAATDYTRAVVTDFGTVTGSTLGNKKHDPADDTQYWNAK